ncbi:MAG TPA: DUF6056 family protein [Methylovorus sp.]|nr:DUF6056 family protein [Methylovorus sp.]
MTPTSTYQTASLLTDVRASRLLRAVRITWLVSAVLFLNWLLWSAWNAVPSVDDFCYGYGGKVYGMFGNVVQIYHDWSGRYVSTFLISAFAGSNDLLLKHYYAVPLFILLLNLAAVIHFVRAFAQLRVFMVLGLFVPLMAFFQLRQSLFWLSGGATYGVACGLFLLIITEALKIYTHKASPTATRISLMSLGALLLAGCNEGAMLANIALLVPLTLMTYLHDHNKRMGWVLLAAIIGALISGLAPGNFVRAALMTHKLDFIQAAWLGLELIIRRYLLAFLALVVLWRIFMELFPFKTPLTMLSRRQTIIITLALFVALWAGIFARAYIKGDLGPSRTRTQDFMLIIVMAFFLARFSYLQYLATSGDARLSWQRTYGIAAVTIVIIGLITTFITYPHKSWKDVMLQVQASRHLHAFMEHRFATALASTNSKLEVPAYPSHLAPITFFRDITADPEHWENRCFADYFQLPEVVTKPE